MLPVTVGDEADRTAMAGRADVFCVRIAETVCRPFSTGLILNQMAYKAGRNTRVSTVPPKGSTDQGVCQRFPKDGMVERNERQQGGEGRQNDRAGAVHGGLDHGIERR